MAEGFPKRRKNLPIASWKHEIGCSQVIHQSEQSKVLWIWLTVWVGVAVLLGGLPGVSGSEENQENRSLFRLEDFVPTQEEKLNARLGNVDRECATVCSFLVQGDVASPQPSPDFSSKKTGSALVGSVMALLATLESANVLPPEGSSQANQLVHGLIQLQSVLVKSHSPVLHDYISAAITYRFDMDGSLLLESIHEKGLTSKMLEALVSYDQKKSIWEEPALTQLFQRYNVSRLDWELIEKIFGQADAAYRMKGISIHDTYEQWRSQMP